MHDIERQPSNLDKGRESAQKQYNSNVALAGDEEVYSLKADFIQAERVN